METVSNQFYVEVLNNSNVVDEQYMNSKIQQDHPEFQFDMFNGDIRTLSENLDICVNSLNYSNITGKYEIPEQKGGKSKGAAILSYQLKTGDIFGLGTRTFQNTYLLKGLKSNFIQHPFKFGDEEQKAMLKKPLNELLLYKDKMSFNEFRKLMSFQITFQMFSKEKLYQTEQSLSQFKHLMLLKEVIGKLVKDDASIKSVPQYKVNGFIQEKYNDFCKDEITMLTVTVSLVPKFSSGLQLNSVVAISKDSADNVLCETLLDETKSIEYIMSQLQMRPMDIVVGLDNCSAKKMGKEVTIMPKLQAINVIIQKQEDQSKQRGHGLNLQKFSQILNKSQ